MDAFRNKYARGRRWEPAKFCLGVLQPEYKMATPVVDRLAISFTGRLAHTQCFPTGSLNEVKKLAGICRDSSMFHP